MALFEGPVNLVAETLSLPSGAVRMISGLFMCQLFALLFRAVRVRDPRARFASHLFLGLFVGYYVWDVTCLHHVMSAVGMYLLFRLLPWDVAARANFLFQLGYIMVGYWHNNMGEDYAINWTTTMAPVTLKMMGLGFDLNDGKDKGLKLPELMRIIGHVFFIGTYMVGPMDDFMRYDAFINCTLFDENKGPELSLGLKRLALGLLYLAISVVTTIGFTTDFMFSNQYMELHLLLRLLYITVWGYFNLYRYMAVWCIAESTCMYLGYTFSGPGQWDALDNFGNTTFHCSLSIQTLINTWNIRTTKWCAKHIYKRCKFLGNKTVSQLLTMLFLALWHGVHFGYFLFFFQEFLYGMVMEKGASKNRLLQEIGSTIPSNLVTVLRWIFIKVFMSFTFVSFELYYFSKIMHVYGSVYYCVPIVCVIVISSNFVFAEKKDKKME